MTRADPRSVLTLVTIQTGLVTALWAVADLVLYITFVCVSLRPPRRITDRILHRRFTSQLHSESVRPLSSPFGLRVS